MFMNQRVFLHKNLKKMGFDILDARMRPLYTDLSYVRMRDVTFVICDKNKTLARETGQKTQHAWVEGILIDALPRPIRINNDQLRLIDIGTPVEYRSSKDLGFVYIHSQQPIETASEIIAYNGRVKVTET